MEIPMPWQGESGGNPPEMADPTGIPPLKSLLWPQQIPGNPTFCSQAIPAPMPAVNLTRRLQTIATLNRQHRRIKGLNRHPSPVRILLEHLQRHVAVATRRMLRPHPAGPGSIDGSQLNLIPRSQTNRGAVLFLIVRIGDVKHNLLYWVKRLSDRGWSVLAPPTCRGSSPFSEHLAPSSYSPSSSSFFHGRTPQAIHDRQPEAFFTHRFNDDFIQPCLIEHAHHIEQAHCSLGELAAAGA